jgi:hypothetical protein
MAEITAGVDAGKDADHAGPPPGDLDGAADCRLPLARVLTGGVLAQVTGA